MNNEKTIKQLADEIGVSKQAVWQKIKRQSSTDLHQLMVKKGNTVYVQEEGQRIIKSMFNENDTSERQHVDDKKNINVDSDVDEVEFLRNLVSDLQAEKKELYKLLDQQQILTLQANKKIEELELKSNERETPKKENDFSFTKDGEEKEEQKVEEPSSNKNVRGTTDKKSFWVRWFKK